MGAGRDCLHVPVLWAQLWTELRPSKFVCWRCPPQDLRTWLGVQMGLCSRDEGVTRPPGRALLHWHCVPVRRGAEDTDTHRGDHAGTRGEPHPHGRGGPQDRHTVVRPRPRRPASRTRRVNPAVRATPSGSPWWRPSAGAQRRSPSPWSRLAGSAFTLVSTREAGSGRLRASQACAHSRTAGVPGSASHARGSDCSSGPWARDPKAPAGPGERPAGCVPGRRPAAAPGGSRPTSPSQPYPAR